MVNQRLLAFKKIFVMVTLIFLFAFALYVFLNLFYFEGRGCLIYKDKNAGIASKLLLTIKEPQCLKNLND